MAFKRLTKQQRAVYAALRALREMVVMPQDARPLKALKARGLIRYRNIGGIRTAILREFDTAEKRRMKRWLRWDFWNAEGEK